MSLKRDILFGSVMLFFFSLLAGVVAYLTKLLLVRNLTVEEYGLFFAIFTFVTFFGVFRSLGLPAGLVRYIADYNSKKKYGEIKSIIIGSTLIRLGVSLLLVILMWIFSDYLAINYFGDERAAWLLRILSLFLPLSIIQDNLKAIFNGYKKSAYVSAITFLQNALILLIIGTLFLLGFGFESVVVGYILAPIVLGLVFLYPLFALTKPLSYKITHFYKTNKDVLLFSLPLILTGIGATIITYFDTLMLTYFDTIENVGIYNIIYPTALLLVIFGTSISTVLLPILTEFWEQRNLGKVKQIFNILYRYIYIIIFPITVLLLQLSFYIVKIMFGEEYLPGVTAFNILIFASIFFIANAINTGILIALKDSEKTAYINLIGASTNVVLNLFLIPLYSITGAAIATLISFIIMAGLSFYYLYVKAGLTIPLVRLSSTLLISMVIPLSVFFINTGLNAYINLGISLFLGGAIYVMLLFVFKLLSLRELKNVFLQKI